MQRPQYKNLAMYNTLLIVCKTIHAVYVWLKSSLYNPSLLISKPHTHRERAHEMSIHKQVATLRSPTSQPSTSRLIVFARRRRCVPLSNARVLGPVNTSPHPKRYLDRFCRFCRAHGRDKNSHRQTDRSCYV